MMVFAEPIDGLKTTLWPIASSRRMVSGDTPRSTRSSSGQSWSWARGAFCASATLSPWSITLTMTCSTTVMMRDPPGLPVAIISLPSLNTSVGLIDDSGRFIGPGALASPPRSP